uniref:Uncharacterized protein LOC111137262 isoform X2 n=1 Tax=Crassostrea virginica TaxID=6565 RepID=A0A8B8EWQ9_CRAVI|nr:uncharacterized protein LOC111137262 isoform X2 [Crassostrea virginica]
MFLVILIVSTVYEIIRTSIAKACYASLDTVVPVNRCPRNNLEWDARAAILNCSSINETCVKPVQLKYHCVLNENCTALVELCASPQPILGRSCAEFNSLGKRIQESIIYCNKTNMVQCPKSYISTEAYNYQSCYDDIKRMKNDDNRTGYSCKFDTSVPLGVGLTCALLCLFLIILYRRYFLKPSARCHCNCWKKDPNGPYVYEETELKNNYYI